MSQYGHPNLIISQSKALESLMTKLRDIKTGPVEFSFYAKRAMRLVAEDAIAELPSKVVEIVTPCGPCEGVEVDTANLCVVSIMRAGDSLMEVVRECLPGVPVGKILIQRQEETREKQPKFYYSKMPPGIANMNVLICDPMLGTAGSIRCAVQNLVEKHMVKTNRIVFVNMLCAPEGLEIMGREYPEIKIVTGKVDLYLNEEKFLVPGLGDYGDRFFNT